MSALHTAPDLQSFKSAVRDQWDKSAEGWNDHTPIIRAWLGSATQAMMDKANIRLHSRVLDVAAGAGDQTLDIAKRVGPLGFVMATDLSPVILELAKTNATRAGYMNVDTLVADGENMALESASFDAAVCRLGLMFFPEPLCGLREMHRVVRPGGRICAVVFSRPEANPCLTLMMSTALKHAGMSPRDPWQPGGLLSLGKPGLLAELLGSAGFTDITSTVADAPFHLPSARHYMDFVRSSASPIQQILGKLAATAADAAWADIEERLSAFTTPTGWVGPNELLITSGLRQ